MESKKRKTKAEGNTTENRKKRLRVIIENLSKELGLECPVSSAMIQFIFYSITKISRNVY